MVISTVAALCGKRPVPPLNCEALIRLPNCWICAESKMMLCAGKRCPASCHSRAAAIPAEESWAEPAGANKYTVRRGKDAGVTAGMVPCLCTSQGTGQARFAQPCSPCWDSRAGDARQCSCFSVHQFNGMWICVPKYQTCVNQANEEFLTEDKRWQLQTEITIFLTLQITT